MTQSIESPIGQGSDEVSQPSPTLSSRVSWKLRSLTNHLPRPAKSGRAGGPLVVAGMFQTGSGLGRSARACYEGLKADGWDPVPVCISHYLRQLDAPTDIPLQPMPKDKSGTLILHANAPETEIVLHRLGLNRLKSWTVIGYWAWELPELPASWASVSELLSEVWVPSSFVKGAMVGQLACRVSVVPHRISMPRKQVRPREREDGPIRCLVMADGRSSLARKNVRAAIETFRTAFDGRQAARLVLKFRNLRDFIASSDDIRAFAAEDSRCELIDATLEQSEVWNLVCRSDVLLSCHRSEGFGLHLAEAMAMGRCAVATGWSGNTDFMTEQNSMLLPYSLTPVDDPDGIYPQCTSSEWAEVDIRAGAERLRALAENHDLRRRIARQAKADMQTLVSGNHYSNALNAIGST